MKRRMGEGKRPSQTRQDAPAPPFDAQAAQAAVTQRQPAEDDAASFSDFPQENPSPVFRISQSAVLLYANPAGQRLLAEWGWAVGQVVARDWQEWIVTALDSGIDQEVEIQAAGRTLALNVHPSIGPARCVNVYGHDITERKRAEAALRDSQEQLASIFDTASEAILSTDQQQRILLFNKAAETIFGYRSDEVLGQPLAMLLPDEFSEIHSRHMHAFGAAPEQAHHMGGSRVVVGRRKDGTEFPLRAGISKTSAAEPAIFTFIGSDMTEQQQAEKSLLESEKRFRALIENGLDNISLLAADGSLLWESPAVMRTLGYVPNEFVGRNTFELMHPDDLDRTRNILAELIREPASRQFGSFRLRRSDGTWRWVEAVVTNLLNEPSVNAIVINYHDVTERRQAEEALAEERNLLRTLIDNLPDAIYVKDLETRFLVKNLADARKMGAATPDETIGKTDFDYYPSELAAQYQADDQAVIASGQAIVNREEPITEATGRPGWVSTTKVPLRDRQGKVNGLVFISHDITERKQAEEEIKSRLAELEAVNRISTALRTAQTLDEMLPVLLYMTLAVLHTGVGSIWLYDPVKNELRTAATRGGGEPDGATLAPPEKPGEGINGYVFANGQPYVASDFHRDAHLPIAVREAIPPGLGGAVIPIRAGDQVIGTFDVNVQLSREVTPSEVHLLTTLSEIAGSAIQRMRLHEQTEQRLNQIVALRAIDTAIAASLDVRVTLNVFLDQVIQQLGVDAADVLLLEADSLTLQHSAGRGFRTRDFQKVRVRVGEGRAGRVALERQMTVLSGAEAVYPPGRRTGSLHHEGFVCYLGVPLIAKGQVLGVLELFHRAPLQTSPEWLAFLEALAGQAAIAIDNARLFDNLQQANRALVGAYDATIGGWSAALDLRDHETEGHSQRVTEITERLARAMGVSDAELIHIHRGALLHDIGKMGVPDDILLKPGPLTADEWAIMRQHPTYAYRLLAPINFLRPALEIPYCHHEKWDGTGYPRGLTGEQIPLAARVFAVVDVWDALRSDRPYRAAWLADRVREYIRSQAGSHFDPQIVIVALESDVLVRQELD